MTVPFATRLRRLSWIIPAALLAVLGGSAVLAPWIAPQDTYDLAQLRLEDANLPPVWIKDRPETGAAPGLFLLGGDRQGRDLLSAILFGMRVSLFVGATGMIVAMTIGVALGLAAGWSGGRFDAAVMRLADIQLSFPSVLIALFMMALWGQGLGKIVLAVGLVHWVIYARVARGGTLAEREKDYVSAARAMGAGTPRILLLHLLPNLSSPLLVVSAVQFASIVMLEATLSYLGLGVPITRPSLGMLVKNGADEVFSGVWWSAFFPGLALALLVVSVNCLADLLRERLAGE